MDKYHYESGQLSTMLFERPLVVAPPRRRSRHCSGGVVRVPRRLMRTVAGGPRGDLLPALRSRRGLSAQGALKWSLPPIRLLELLYPEILGRTAFAAPPRYLGAPFEDDDIANVFLGPVAPLPLVPGASAAGSRKLLLPGGLAALLGMGEHLPLLAELLALAPWASVARYPAKLYRSRPSPRRSSRRGDRRDP